MATSSTRYTLPDTIQNNHNTYDPKNLHPMITRSKIGITKLKHPFIGAIDTTLPNTVSTAIQSPHWSQAM